MREGLKPFMSFGVKFRIKNNFEWMDGPFSMIDSENASEFVRRWRISIGYSAYLTKIKYSES